MTEVYIVFYLNRTYGPQFIDLFSKKSDAEDFISRMYKAKEYYIAKRIVR